MLHLHNQRDKMQHKSHEPKISELVHPELDTLKGLDVSDIHWEAFCLLMAFSCRWLYKQLRLSPRHTAPALSFMTNSLQQHQSLMTK